MKSATNPAISMVDPQPDLHHSLPYTNVARATHEGSEGGSFVGEGSYVAKETRERLHLSFSGSQTPQNTRNLTWRSL